MVCVFLKCIISGKSYCRRVLIDISYLISKAIVKIQSKAVPLRL